MQVVLDEANESYQSDVVLELPSNSVDEMEQNIEKIVAKLQQLKK